MKTPLATVVLVAVVSSLAAVGSFELLRGSLLGSPQTLASAPLPEAPASAAPRSDDDLRELVLAWMSEEREARRRAEELAHAEEQREQMEFDAWAEQRMKNERSPELYVLLFGEG